MLASLHITKYVLIEELQIDFSEGFSVISGETGAGKSILLGALSLLLGKRADSSEIAPGADKCVVEGVFQKLSKQTEQLLLGQDLDFDPEECILRREISVKGKSRAFINDTPVSLSTLKSVAGSLIDIHSQHQNLLLGDPFFQLSSLDAIADIDLLLAHYQEKYRTYIDHRKTLEELQATIERDTQEIDFLRFRYSELQDASLKEGEEKKLEEELRTLSHASEIAQGVGIALSALSENDTAALSAIHSAIESLSRITAYSSTFSSYRERLQSLRIELQDIANSLSQEAELLSTDPTRLAQVEDRWDLLNTLMHKHKASTIEGLLDIREELKNKLNRIDHSEEDLKQEQEVVERILSETNKLADELHGKRLSAAGVFEKELKGKLPHLGIPQAKFEVDIRPATLSIQGRDRVTFLFSANAQQKPQDVSEVASGGEISRLMLIIKSVIAKRRELPSIIFDEVDTGISGDVASRMAEMLRHMGQHMQVIAITHLPQIAAYGKNHYFVYKQSDEISSKTSIRRLNREERIREIARMQSGNLFTQIGLAAAEELLLNSTEIGILPD
ncbi:hypothetical protein HQ45_08560 [Porphyromonas crevioricanis]|uniref:DNA repair protein RecN n=2 Tax=Porphyromonas crevioricanis TaxID=393921 RepID=A0A0A2FK95_9PORP|nr:DNA repair protein RecN [Porphyromonas crevioricanis]KGN88739.1 hypothetical protein HQ45_08560 [Porphyromonas crevioricanis]KGN93891.1 hypothetical protein HQ38_07705 [Porphyromonas crevioricanis]SJZ89081.1 DNA repair protein RecN (Recombination protein N) [Porphyromonas crevioricanis]SQH73645.1 Recombination protein N [Porphyromonas crevioricanis]GAD05443.1 DNA repair protein RecN [Porphyromonas crevioricanis JCM 15906]